MSKAKWGGIIVIVIAVAIIVLLGSNAFRTEKEAGERADAGSSIQAGGSDEQDNDAGGADNSNKNSTASAEGESNKKVTVSAKGTGSTEGESNKKVTASAKGNGRSDNELEKEAESYVKKLTEPSDLPLEVHNAEGFVGPEQTLASSTAEAGHTQSSAPVETEEVRAQAESAQPEADETKPAEPSSQPEGLQTQKGGRQQVAVNLPLSEESPVTIADIVGSGPDVPPDAVYYVHTVRDTDVQGIWGIVQQGVVENFAQGVAVRHGGSLETYRVEIPRNADELRSDKSSSFLGRLIYEKSRESYVYNYETGRVGKNPDFITPGQEIVIVSFTPEELIDIYKHFAKRAEGQG